jgi:5'-phosphate synthase pdxT subunit
MRIESSMSISTLTIGVLALQGDFERHRHQLDLVGAASTEVRVPSDLNGIDGLIIPGGESTTMDKLIDRFAMRESLLEFASIRAIFGTCAGMIMLSKRIEDNQSNVTPLDLMDIDVVRNGYGRQVHSFSANLNFDLGKKQIELAASFIRAPRITRTGESVKIFASYDGSPVLVEEANILAGSFHAELDDDTQLTEYFLTKTVACLKGRL